MQPRTAAALLAFAGVALLAGTAAAQLAPAPAPAAATTTAAARPPVAIHHSFPLAGGTLALVIDGLDPDESVVLRLDQPESAPPSLLSGLGAPTTLLKADEQGRIALAVPLDDPADADRAVSLAVLRNSSAGEELAAALSLRVQPPTLVLAADQGLVRVDLRQGALLDPAIPGAGGLRGMALASTGTSGFLLRDGGLLEHRSAGAWDGLPLSIFALDAFSDTLAGSLLGGAAFVLSRPTGEPYTPSARLQFVDGAAEPLLLEPMGERLAGRRAVVSDDGLTAFVAEDDLLVREIDLVSRQPRGLLAAGLAGDRQITDLLLDGRRLLVATRGAAGRAGALTTVDLDTGRTTVAPLAVDPLRLVAIAAGVALVVPASGSAAQVLEAGQPSRLLDRPGTTLLDAAALDGVAILLRVGPDGTTLERAQAQSGRVAPLALQTPLPAVNRLAGRGEGVLVLLGDPDGAVLVLDPAQPAVAPVPGVSARPGAPFVILP